ncbi:hypothetical protein G7046_g6196 [Stylonectria norvegica]|nr:hypothetical protein G7046_g6196 [Stylonectria norvegica]
MSGMYGGYSSIASLAQRDENQRTPEENQRLVDFMRANGIPLPNEQRSHATTATRSAVSTRVDSVNLSHLNLSEQQRLVNAMRNQEHEWRSFDGGSSARSGSHTNVSTITSITRPSGGRSAASSNRTVIPPQTNRNPDDVMHALLDQLSYHYRGISTAEIAIRREFFERHKQALEANRQQQQHQPRQ